MLTLDEEKILYECRKAVMKSIYERDWYLKLESMTVRRCIRLNLRRYDKKQIRLKLIPRSCI